MPNLDFVIVGGGPAGLLSAILLAKQNFKVQVLESSSVVRRKVCGEYLCPKGVELLDSLGLGHLLAGFGRIEGMDLYSPEGMKVETKFPNTKTFGRALKRDIFEQRLLEEAQKVGALVRFGCRVEEIKQERNAWIVSTLEGKVQSRFLLGADGRHSFVAKSLGLDFKKKSDDRIAVHAFLKGLPRTNQGEMHLLSAGAYVGLDPVDDDEWNLSFICDARELRGINPAEFLQRKMKESVSLNSRFPVAPQEHELKVVYPISNRVRAISGNSWALLGDAAGFLDPLTGEGVFQALLSAKMLADSFEETTDSLVAFANYKRRYKREIQMKGVLNRGFQWLLRHPTWMNFLGRYLKRSTSKSNAFIGIVGNTIPISRGIMQMIFSDIVNHKKLN